MRTADIVANGTERSLTPEEAAHLLSVEDCGLSFYNDLFAAAFEVRRQEKGTEFILDGFLGTVCGCTINPPCHYCACSAGREFPPPLGPGEVREGARYIASTGTRRLEVGAGTNPAAADRIVECASVAAESSDMHVWVNAGPSFDRRHLEQLKEAGVEEVGASLETINSDVFARVKPGDSMKKRMRLTGEIKEVGLKLASVMMVGLGSSTADYVRHIFWLKDVGVDHMPITGLNPIPGTPLETARPASPVEVCRVVAVARLVLRDTDISVGGMMNDPRLLPLQIMAGTNRAIHLGAHVHRPRRDGSFRNWPATESKEASGLVFSNLRPTSEGILRELGLKPA